MDKGLQVRLRENALAHRLLESSAPVEAPDINHVQRREEEPQRLHSVDLPPDSYYLALEKWRREKFPNADSHVLDRLNYYGA